jgi:hypothetical protein
MASSKKNETESFKINQMILAVFLREEQRCDTENKHPCLVSSLPPTREKSELSRHARRIYERCAMQFSMIDPFVLLQERRKRDAYHLLRTLKNTGAHTQARRVQICTRFGTAYPHYILAILRQQNTILWINLENSDIVRLNTRSAQYCIFGLKNQPRRGDTYSSASHLP